MLLRFWTMSVRPPQDDFPHASAPGVPTGFTVDEAIVEYGWTHSPSNRAIGRDNDGNPVWVKLSGQMTYANDIATEGVRAQSGILQVNKAGAQFAVVECDADHTVASAVHADEDHEVLAAVLHPSEDPDDVGAGLSSALEAWDPDVEFTGDRRTSARDFLVARGVPSAWLSAWAADNPGATPRDFWRDLRAWART